MPRAAISFYYPAIVLPPPTASPQQPLLRVTYVNRALALTDRLHLVWRNGQGLRYNAMVLTVLNLVFWVSILFNLPGTWLMVLVTAVLKWWQPGDVLVSWTVLGVAAGVAVVGGVLEFSLGATGSRRAGGSPRAAALAIVGSLVGGILGTALPVPIVDTLIGVCIGAFEGSLGDLGRGRTLFPSFEAGWGLVLGNGIEALDRRHHSGRPGAGRVLLRGRSRMRSVFTGTVADTVEPLPSWPGSSLISHR